MPDGQNRFVVSEMIDFVVNRGIKIRERDALIKITASLQHKTKHKTIQRYRKNQNRGNAKLVT